MLSCQDEQVPEKPEVRDPPPKGPPGVAPKQKKPGEPLDRPEVRDPPPKGPPG
jgi:hypothetical protein